MSSGGPGTAEDEFRAFVASTQTRLLRVALTLDRGLAEGLVQTAYLRTYARWGRLRDQDPVAYPGVRAVLSPLLPVNPAATTVSIEYVQLLDGPARPSVVVPPGRAVFVVIDVPATCTAADDQVSAVVTVALRSASGGTAHRRVSTLIGPGHDGWRSELRFGSHFPVEYRWTRRR